MQDKESIQAYLRRNQAAMFQLLKELVLIQSGTANKKGVDRVANVLSERLGRLRLRSTIHPREKTGDLLEAATRQSDREKGILLIGHMDTAYPPESVFNWYREDREKAYGPGVVDMKGGLTAAVFALEALYQVGMLDKIPLTFICTPDEEMGSISSRPIIAEQARRSFAAFILEAASPGGEVVTGRKGRLTFTLKVSGRTSHSAYQGAESASAIEELAHKITAIYALAGLAPGVSINVGTVHGGIAHHTVADLATAQIDVRMIQAGDADLFLEETRKIMDRPVVRGATCCIEGISRMPPMECTPANKGLYDLVAGEARILGFELGQDLRPGCSDANTVALEGIPVLDGMGPVGGGYHSEREYMIKESLVQRSELLAFSILECWRQKVKG